MDSSSSSLRVLFIGNSFTYANDLEKVFTLFMRSRGVVVEAKRVAKGGYSFAQHLKDLENSGEELYSLLGEGSESKQKWDYVILQDQSQIPGTFQYKGLWEGSKDALLQLAAIATQKGATVVLLQTWAHREGNYDRSNAFFTQLFPDYLTMQRLLITGYEMYKNEIEKAVSGSNVVIAPAGKAWSLIHDAIEGESADSICALPENVFPGGSGTFKALYAEDDYHPSPKGTVLAALVLVETLLGLPSFSKPSQENLNTSERLTVQSYPQVSDTWANFLLSVACAAVTDNTSHLRSWIQQKTEILASESSNTELRKKGSKQEL